MLILADMAVERHADDLGQALAHLERPCAVAAERRHFQIAHQARMVGHEIDPLRDREIHQAADVALDELGADNAHRPDIRPGVEIRDGMAAQQRREFVHHPRCPDRRRRHSSSRPGGCRCCPGRRSPASRTRGCGYRTSRGSHSARIDRPSQRPPVRSPQPPSRPRQPCPRQMRYRPPGRYPGSGSTRWPPFRDCCGPDIDHGRLPSARTGEPFEFLSTQATRLV